MSTQNQENLKKLLERFLDPNQVRQALEDVHKGEQILREHAAPEPDADLIAGIKAQIGSTLMQNKAKTRRMAAYKAAAVAAVLAVVAAVSLKVLEKDGGPEATDVVSKIDAAIWQSDDIAQADAELATLAAEIEQISAEVLAVEFAENAGNGYEALTELEMEFIEISSDFWKG